MFVEITKVKDAQNITIQKTISDTDESSVFKAIGEELLDVDIPSTLTGSVAGLGSIELKIGKRGTVMKKGVALPSMYVTVNYNSISTTSSSYDEAYLQCINPEGNNYKYYNINYFFCQFHTITIIYLVLYQ